MPYTYAIEYHGSEGHGNADTSSRLPRTQKDDTAAEQDVICFYCVNQLPVEASGTAEHSSALCIFWKVGLRTTETLFIERPDLREVIPPMHRHGLLKDSHDGHQGICGRKL